MSDVFARDKLNNWAGGFYLAANTAVLFKGVIEHALETGAVEFAKVTEDPVSAVVGGCFVTGASIMSTMGHKNRGALAAMTMNTIGNGIFIADMIADSKPVSTIVGATFGLVAAGYAVYQCIKNEFKNNRQEVSEPAKKEEVATSRFVETAKEMTAKYPFLPVAAINLVSSTMIAIGAIQANDMALLGIATSWTIGSLFLSRAAPKVQKNQPLYEPA